MDPATEISIYILGSPNILFIIIISAIILAFATALISNPLIKMIEISIISSKNCFNQIKNNYWKKKKTQIPPSNRGTMKLGSMETSWRFLDGDGKHEYDPKNINCIVKPLPLVLPDDIQIIKDKINSDNKTKEQKGEKYHWVGDLYALEDFVVNRTPNTEQMACTVTLRPTDYNTFQATVANLDQEIPGENTTIRKKYLEGKNHYKPIGFLANGLGVAIVVRTNDNKTVIVRRSVLTGVRPGEVDVSTVEGVSPLKDKDFTDRPNFHRTAARGLHEELSLTVPDDKIILLGFGVDEKYYQWNFIGFVEVDKTADEVIMGKYQTAIDKFESQSLEAVNFTPKDIFEFLKQETMWSSGMAALYFALIYVYEKDEVNKAANEIFSDYV